MKFESEFQSNNKESTSIIIGTFEVIIDAEDYTRIVKLPWHLKKFKYRTQNVIYFTYGRKTAERESLLHRYILNKKLNKNDVVDHINGNNLDNRKINLRICTVSENTRNRKKPKTNTSGYKGVFESNVKDKPWRSRIMYEGKSYNLGCFRTKEEAYKAYCNASQLYHGSFGRII